MAEEVMNKPETPYHSVANGYEIGIADCVSE